MRNIRRWRLLAIDDNSEALNTNLATFDKLMGAVVRELGSEPESGSDRAIWPELVLIKGRPAEAAFCDAWEYIEGLLPEEFPDLALIDMRLDGNPSAEAVREIGDFKEENPELYTRFERIVDDIDRQIHRRHQEYIEAYREVDRAVLPAWKEDPSEHKAVRDLWSAPVFEAGCTAFRQELRSALLARHGDRTTENGMGVLSRGGYYLGQKLLAKAREPGYTNPVILYYSGSHLARVSLLPGIVAGTEEMLQKEEVSFAPVAAKVLENRACELLRMQLTSTERLEVVQRLITALELNEDEEEMIIPLVDEECSLFEGWTVGSLFPWRVVKHLGPMVYNFHVHDEENTIHEFGVFLRERLPSIDASTRSFFTSYPGNYLLHPAMGCPSTASEETKAFHRNWGYHEQRIGQALRESPPLRFVTWVRAKVSECVEKGLGRIVAEVIGEGGADGGDAIKQAMTDRIEADVRNPQTMTDRWPFPSALVRATVQESLCAVLNARCVALTDGTAHLRRDSEGRYVPHDPRGDLEWFCITPDVAEYLRNAEAPRAAETGRPEALLSQMITSLSGFATDVDRPALLHWESRRERGARQPYEETLIWIYLAVDGGFRIERLTGDDAMGDAGVALWSALAPACHYYSLSGIDPNGRRASAVPVHQRFELDENTLGDRIDFPTDSSFCWRLMLRTYRRGGGRE